MLNRHAKKLYIKINQNSIDIIGNRYSEVKLI